LSHRFAQARGRIGGVRLSWRHISTRGSLVALAGDVTSGQRT
jgi:hypothetical protein